MKPLPINKKLIWDYDIPEDAQTNEAFREWYVKRVLTHGTMSDICAIGLATIHWYLPQLFLPQDIGAFWYWYFAQPQVQERYGYLNPISETTS